MLTHEEPNLLLSTEFPYTGTAGLPLVDCEPNKGRKCVKEGALRTHRILNKDEFDNQKSAKWRELEVHGCVRVLSPAIFAMKNLTSLFLSHNYLESIPPEICHLTGLTILDVSYNRLRSLPAELGNMSALLHLNLRSNNLTHLPAEIGKLFKLKSIAILENPLPEILLENATGTNCTKRILQILLDELALSTPPPPKRAWISLPQDRTDKPVAQFSVLCYNVLCDKYATNNMYSYCPRWALHWEYRKHIILKEIVNFDADLISLQEVESEQYQNMFEGGLKQHGYEGVFAAKTRARTMKNEDRRHVDGCALFWKKKKFRLTHKHVVEFTQVAIHKAHDSEHVIDRVMPKDNIAQVAVLDVLPDLYVQESAPPKYATGQKQAPAKPETIDRTDRLLGSPLLFCCAHIHWDPEFCDVKLIQSMMLLHECAKQLERLSEQTGIAVQEIPVIISGDFNSLPDSGVVEFLTRGIINKNHPELKMFRDSMVLNGMCTNEYGDTSYTHAFQLEQAVPQEYVPHTNYTHDFKGMIDYIFSSNRSLHRDGFLAGIDQDWLHENRVTGFPHPHVPSDHIPLFTQYTLIPPHQRSPAIRYPRFRRRTASFTRAMEDFAKERKTE
ncbi:unnamed protein product [Bursaphelenchus xylophilus]|uniref:poly(A)-specific ribonuclease n=1 Tax=Bursaphelenchus xylophilus TaxID=6326 RepID=A0A1I7SCN4_BURXY|nr:unnamed protein product [Bursaphelenchus xylophilus]CAG9093799.1 unnamed protein product [Bursaphelenchus xylophilus]